MRELRTSFFEERKRLDADPATRAQAVCWICGQRIDYDAAPGSTEDSLELDHALLVAHPEVEEDPSNFKHAHRRCNNKRGKTAPRGDLVIRSHRGGECLPEPFPSFRS